jgi:DNA polymerase-4
MIRTRKILHLDLDAFFCSVEELRDPSLRGKAFAVGGRPETRGVVASCSYPARIFGIRSAMPMARALKLCPDMTIVSGHYEAYQKASASVMERLGRLTPLVEQISIDEAFLDVSHIDDPAEVVGRQLQAQVMDELGLPSSIGVATNKLVAKIATEVGKARAEKGFPPRALTVVPPGYEEAFLAPLPARMLWGVGPKTAERLAGFGVKTIGDIAAIPQTRLAHHFGQVGTDLAHHARGIDDRAVLIDHDVKSLSQEVTFPEDISDEQYLRSTLCGLADQVGRRLRKAGFVGDTVRLKLRWPNFTTLSRQTRLAHPSDQDSAIRDAALGLFHKTWKRDRAVRLLGVGVTGLSDKPRQLTLWSENGAPEGALQEAMDAVKDRFGDDAIRRGPA